MKKRFLVAILILAISCGIIPAYATGTTEPIDNSTYFRTSDNDENYIAFTIDGNKLTISGQLIMENFGGYMVRVGNRRERFDASAGKPFSATISLHGIEEISAVDFYTTEKSNQFTYRGMIWDRIYLMPSEDGYVFLQSSVLDNNLEFQNEWLNPGDYLNENIPEAIQKKSDEIVGSETDDYKKIFLLHQWVAKNIYYDYDYYYGKGNTFYNAEDILVHGRTVCSGYAELLKQLILAQGIPCMEASTYALGLSANGGSFAVKTDFAGSTTTNHAHVEAFVDGRWVVMDPTWDSNNTYKNGTYITEAPSNYYYFDISLEAMALDHKYITRGDGKIRLAKDGSITNSNTTAEGTAPSLWATKEVQQALSLGVIPYELQSNYQGDITREDFCKCVVQMMLACQTAKSLDELLERHNLKMLDNLFNDTTNPYVYTANLLGVVYGTGNGNFQPDNSISRQEAAVMLTRAAQVLGMDTDVVSDIAFSDSEKIHSWAKDGVNFVYHIGVMKGVSDDAFAPDGNLTREQTYLTVLRLYNSCS